MKPEWFLWRGQLNVQKCHSYHLTSPGCHASLIEEQVPERCGCFQQMASSTGQGSWWVLLNSLWLFQGQDDAWYCWLFLWLFHPPGITYLFFRLASRSCWLLLAFLLIFLPSGITFFPYSTSSTGPSSEYFIQQESSLSPPWPPKLGKFHTWCHWWPSDYFIHQELSLSLLYCVFNTAKITLGVVGLPRLFHPPGIFSISSMVCSTGYDDIGRCWLPSCFFPYPRNHVQHEHCPFLHPADSFFLPYHYFSPVL